MPPLRDHRDDISPLVRHFLRRYSHEQGKRDIRVSGAAFERLLAHDWPGNVRQLANEIRRLVAFAGDGTVIEPEHLAQADRVARCAAGRGPRITATRTRSPSPRTSRWRPPSRRSSARSSCGRCWPPGAASARRPERLGVSRKGLLLMRRRLQLDPFLVHD